MRAVVAMCCLALGCRMNFDAVDDSDGGTATDADATSPSSCIATVVPGFDVAPNIGDLLAARTPGGYALGFIRSTPSDLTGVFLDNAHVPDRSAATRMTPAGGTGGIYTAGTFYWDGANLTGAIREDNSNVYLKTYPLTMDDFLTDDLRPGSTIGEPSIGRTTSITRSTWFTGTTVNYATLDGAGIPLAGSDQVAGDTPATILSSSVGTADDEMFVFTALSNLACHVHVVDEQDSAVSNQIPSPCTDPHASGNTVVHKAGSDIVLRRVSSSGLVISDATTITTSGSKPRLFADGSLVAFLDASGLAVATTSGVALPVTGLPMIPPSAFEVAGPYVFAVFGEDLYSIACP